MGLNPSHFGPLLITVILERLPNEIKSLITRKLGKNNWKILELVECIKEEEVDARESYEFSNEKLDEEYCRNCTFISCYWETLDKKLRVLRKKSLQ